MQLLQLSKAEYSKVFLIVSNGIYDGFWGENGYNNIIILVQKPKSDVWYKLCEEVDKFTIFDITERQIFNLDIPNDYEVPRIWFLNPIKIDYSVPTSDIFGYMESKEENEWSQIIISMTN